ncbi:helix-turn-helix domain-containing protein [Enterococcus thailandicus]|nr:helix-turn-helix transcriptional regulator [Enterococcus thailandicus]
MKVGGNMFSKNLKYLRQIHDMEQIELAQKLGRKSSSSISEWEKGKYTPKIGTLNDIAEIFNVSIFDLMNTDLSVQSSEKLDDINYIYEQLNNENKHATYNFAKQKLNEQNKIVSLNTSDDEIFTLAAHSNDPNHIHSDEEISEINDFLDEIDKKYDDKHKK